MSYSFTVKDSDLICEGDGVSFLKLKARLNAFLGKGQIKSLDKKTFSLSLSSASLASSIFQEVSGITPSELQETNQSNDYHAIARSQAMRIISEGEILPLEVPWNEQLDPAQAIAVSAMITPKLKGLCLFDEQGIGKTVTAIAAFDILFQHGEADCLIVVSPLTMKESWKAEIERFVPAKYNIVVLEGNGDMKRQALLSPFNVLICNFESIESLLVVMQGILKKRKTLLVVDESFNVKNENAVRSISVRELRRVCSRGFVLCGTPAPNSSIDVINQYNIADDGFTFAGFVVPKEERERKEQINKRIETRGTTIRRLKEQVLPDLPAKDFTVIQVTLAGRQADLYEEARGKLELNLRSMDNVAFKRSLATYFQQRSALLQICACPETIDHSFFGPSGKILALDKLIDDIVEKQKKKLVIWSFYQASLKQIMDRYQKYSPVLLDGTSSAKERAIAVQRFQNDTDVRLCVANPAAAGAGVTLHAASSAVYISYSNQAAHFLQSIDRIHRRGQKSQTVSYFLVVCKGTIEEGEVKRLRLKETNQNELLGDQVKWPNSLDEALSELTTSYE